MTDKRIVMDCPFCHTEPNQIQINQYGASKYTVLRCPNCGCEFTGQSKQELINKWNCR
jgi:hypothetical protein